MVEIHKIKNKNNKNIMLKLPYTQPRIDWNERWNDGAQLSATASIAVACASNTCCCGSCTNSPVDRSTFTTFATALKKESGIGSDCKHQPASNEYGN